MISNYIDLIIVSQESNESRTFSRCSAINSNQEEFAKILSKVGELDGRYIANKTHSIVMPTDESFHKLTLYIEKLMTPCEESFDIIVNGRFFARYCITKKMKKNWQQITEAVAKYNGILKAPFTFEFKNVENFTNFTLLLANYF